MAARLRKNDQVEVISGSDKGKRGKILQMLPREKRAIVQGVNLAKHHEKPKGYGQPGGIVTKEASIDLSNLALVDPDSGKTTKVGFRIAADGKKVRVAKVSDQAIEG